MGVQWCFARQSQKKLSQTGDLKVLWKPPPTKTIECLEKFQRKKPSALVGGSLLLAFVPIILFRYLQPKCVTSWSDWFSTRKRWQMGKTEQSLPTPRGENWDQVWDFELQPPPSFGRHLNLWADCAAEDYDKFVCQSDLSITTILYHMSTIRRQEAYLPVYSIFVISKYAS